MQTLLYSRFFPYLVLSHRFFFQFVSNMEWHITCYYISREWVMMFKLFFFSISSQCGDISTCPSREAQVVGQAWEIHTSATMWSQGDSPNTQGHGTNHHCTGLKGLPHHVTVRAPLSSSVTMSNYQRDGSWSTSNSTDIIFNLLITPSSYTMWDFIIKDFDIS